MARLNGRSGRSGSSVPLFPTACVYVCARAHEYVRSMGAHEYVLSMGACVASGAAPCACTQRLADTGARAHTHTNTHTQTHTHTQMSKVEHELAQRTLKIQLLTTAVFSPISSSP